MKEELINEALFNLAQFGYQNAYSFDMNRGGSTIQGCVSRDRVDSALNLGYTEKKASRSEWREFEKDVHRIVLT